MIDDWSKYTASVEEEEKKVSNVRNIVGTPTSVEDQVNLHLKNGYEINSPLMPWTEPNSLKMLFVQQVVLYEGDEDGRTTSRREN